MKEGTKGKKERKKFGVSKKATGKRVGGQGREGRMRVMIRYRKPRGTKDGNEGKGGEPDRDTGKIENRLRENACEKRKKKKRVRRENSEGGVDCGEGE